MDGTAPFKWNGGNPDLSTECGPRTEKFFYRSQSYNAEELADLVTFIKSIPVRPNRYRLANGELTPAQERGKAIFERTRRKDGTPIPETTSARSATPDRTTPTRSWSTSAPGSRRTVRRWSTCPS